MAWTLDSCEVEINREGSGQDSQDSYYHVEDLFIREVDDLVFYGRVKDCADNGLEGALLKVFARRADGREIALTHTYSGKNGYYLVNVPRPEFAVSKYVIRSSMSSSPPRLCHQAQSRGVAGAGREEDNFEEIVASDE